MSIWVTGDIHGNPVRLNRDNFPEQRGMTKEDYVIILGDFGLIWNADGESAQEKWWLKWLEEKPFTTLFVDGNHENHWRLAEYPVKEWNGGKVHEIRPSVLHLMRGEVFEFHDKKFFAFGGASSHDIKDGIIDSADEDWREQAKRMDKEGKWMFRIKGLSWWPEELPSEEEMQNGINNLEKHDWKVDFILSHSPAASVIALLGQGFYKQDIVSTYLEEIRGKTDYVKSFAGHMHENKMMNSKDLLLYEQIIRIA